MDKVKIKVAYIDSDNALGYKHKEFPGYADFTMWACEESNRLKDGLKIIGMNVVIGESDKDAFVNIRPMSTDKLEGFDKDQIEAVDNFLSDDSIYDIKE